jgi:hypothetical protein
MFFSTEEKIEAVFSAGGASMGRRDTTDSAETRIGGRHMGREGR